MKPHKQTWWDENIKDQFDAFKSWVGPTNSPSKKWTRNYITKNNFKSILDIGCGMCDEFFEYKKIDKDIDWKGVEGSSFLWKKAVSKNIPVLNQTAHNINVDDNSYDVVYSRHVLEHQEHFLPMLKEMIRVGSKTVIHIFFIRPGIEEIIHYNKKDNLYHNTYNKSQIEGFLILTDKVKEYRWENIKKASNEIALVIDLV